jgi:hypothetical protein
MSAAANGHKVAEGADELVDWANNHKDLVSLALAGRITGMRHCSCNKMRIVVEVGRLVVRVTSAGWLQNITLLTSDTGKLCRAIKQEFGRRKNWRVEVAA